MKKALITGCNGFVGKWLIDFCRKQNVEVHGLDLSVTAPDSSLPYFQADLSDENGMRNCISSVKPDYIFNLAGVSFLPDADASPKKALDSNISGTMALLDAIRIHAPSARLLIVGSSREYDETASSGSITETQTPSPVNVYGISKYMSELIGLLYHRQYKIDIRCTRSFNHTGPGQSPRFVCSEWAKQAALITLGRADPVITVGNMDANIDFSDVRDVVAAYYAIIVHGQPGEVYNVSSGKGVDLQWILGYLIDKTGHKIDIRKISNKLRINESSVKMVGNSTKLHLNTGWTPSIPLAKTLDDLYAWWLHELTS